MFAPCPPTAIYASRILTPQEEISDGIIVVEGSRIAGLGHRDDVRDPSGRGRLRRDGDDRRAGLRGLAYPWRWRPRRDGSEREGSRPHHLHCRAPRDHIPSCHHCHRAAERDQPQPRRESRATFAVTRTSEDNSRPAAEILGIHLEGPFVSKARRGVHPPDSLARPSVDILEELLEAADGLVRILTLAPELPGALDLIARSFGRNIVVALGHTDADYDQARAAIHAGARHAVHVFNAMRPFSHRDPGVLGASAK